ncbi:MAG: hypothetical protein Q7S57_04685 [bacterium]|nr:hypothetical protein [bacterium]
MLLKEKIKTIRENMDLIPVILLPTGTILCTGQPGGTFAVETASLTIIAMTLGHPQANLVCGCISGIDLIEGTDAGPIVYCKFTSRAGTTFVIEAEGKDFLWMK